MDKTASAIAAEIVQMTNEFTSHYFMSEHVEEKDGVKSIDKQLWAALHIGYVVGMRNAGYPNDVLDSAIEIAQAELTKQQKEYGSK